MVSVHGLFYAEGTSQAGMLSFCINAGEMYHDNSSNRRCNKLIKVEETI